MLGVGRGGGVCPLDPGVSRGREFAYLTQVCRWQGSAPAQRISGLSRARDSAPPTRPFVNGLKFIQRVSCQDVFPASEPGSPLLCKKMGRFSKTEQRVYLFLGEGGLFYGVEIFPTHPTLLRGGDGRGGNAKDCW